MRASIKLLLLASLGSSLAMFNACSSDSGGGGNGGNSGGSDCERLCDRMNDLECTDEDCVDDCEAELPKCDAEFRDFVSCSADAQVFTCGLGQFGGDGCEDEQTEFSECLNSGNTGGAGGGPSGPGGAGPGPGPGGGGPGTDCEKLCDKAATAGCEPTDCVNQCGMQLPKCDAEFDAFNTCAANSGTITCANGKPDVAGCDTEETAFTDCLLGGGGSCYENQGECDPTVANSCAGGQTCDFGQAGYVCYPDGTKGPLEPCASAEECGDNTTCAQTNGGNTCLAFCCDDTDCVAGGTCTDYGTAPSGEPVKLCAP